MKNYTINNKSWSVDEWVKLIPGELYDDGVGLWQIIPFLQEEFDLNEEENLYYIRLAIYELYEQGARPVTFADKDSSYYWKILPQYGVTKEEIATNVIKEWIDNGKDPDPGGLWFALMDKNCFISEDYLKDINNSNF